MVISHPTLLQRGGTDWLVFHSRSYFAGIVTRSMSDFYPPSTASAAEQKNVKSCGAEADDDGPVEDECEDDLDTTDGVIGDEAAAKKKKKKKSKKKKKAAAAAGEGEAADQNAPEPSISVSAAGSLAATQQTDPPSVPVRVLFPSGKYPEGEWQSYKQDNLWRETSAENREQDRLQWDLINQVGVPQSRGGVVQRPDAMNGEMAADRVSLGHAWGFENCNMVMMHEVVCVNACMHRNHATLPFPFLSILDVDLSSTLLPSPG